VDEELKFKGMGQARSLDFKFQAAPQVGGIMGMA
jgi:hypothetical protein